MRTRNQSKLKEEDPKIGDSTTKSHDEEASLAKISKEAVGKLLNRVKSRRGRRECRLSEDTNEKLSSENCNDNKEDVGDFGRKGCVNENVEKNKSNNVGVAEGTACGDANEMDWEEGTISVPEFGDDYSHGCGREVTIEFNDSPCTTLKKRSRRASAEDKELAELVHKVHLLCLVARGRLVDNACNDPLIQASILSLVPSCLHKAVEAPRLKANMLGSLVRWFHENFRIHNESIDRGSFHFNLAYALEAREGTAEEVAALSVALFRALNLRTRYVSILDVASLKPDIDVARTSISDAPRLDTRLSSSITTIASSIDLADSVDTAKENNAHESPQGNSQKKVTKSTFKNNLLKDVTIANQADDGTKHAIETKTCGDNLDSCPAKPADISKRKGDLEFELQMEMALSATAARTPDSKLGPDMHESTSSSSSTPPFKKLKKTDPSVSSSSSLSAVWSRKNGPPLYWAEVYCSLETFSGRWVHIDAASGVVDGEGKVEAAAAACRKPLKYVVAFAGNGAKDVTRRYCMQWYKIAPRRINADWWDTVLAPLKKLESCATSGIVDTEPFQENTSELDKKNSELVNRSSGNPLKSSSSQEYPGNENLSTEPKTYKQNEKAFSSESPSQFPRFSSGISLEDVELETRALTEPLPTNQAAYKNHHLYAIEKWLTKYQILHPLGPVLGYCAGHPVYPRSCVQTLQTTRRWLREGFQVKADETPAKVVKHSKKNANVKLSEPTISGENDEEPTIELYGKWQLEPLQLPHAVNGIVPKNEWGRVDVWSEKCLPPGTIHLKLPRLASVARRLGIDFASAMVGFEFRNGRSYPVYDGIVVCTEFRDAIMEAYREEEERRESEERRRNEAQALSRWFQLLSSIVTRQRLQNSYVDSSSLNAPKDISNSHRDSKDSGQSDRLNVDKKSTRISKQNAQDTKSILPSANEHVHVFPREDQSFDEDSMIRTKRCPCGFSIQVEEL